MKHQITAHKGGRTSRLYLRVRPEVKVKAERIAKARGITLADLIEQLIEEAPE